MPRRVGARSKPARCRRAPASSRGKPCEPIALKSLIPCSITASRSRGGRREEQRQDAGARLAVPAVAGRRHDRSERADAVRVPRRRASGRSSRPCDAPTMCAGARSSSRAGRRCRRPCRRACTGSRPKRRVSSSRSGGGAASIVRRAPGVAVVEADDVEAAPASSLAELVVPGDHLHPEAHDQQQRRVGRVAESSRSRA